MTDFKFNFEDYTYGAKAIAMKYQKKVYEEITQALARGYCTDRNSGKELDAALIEDQAAEVFKYLQNEF